MNSFKKLLASFIAVLSLIAINPIEANAEWKSNTTGWWYTEGSSWATGWKNINGNWYYFYSDGYMAHDCWVENYYLNSSGAWTTDVPSSTTTTNSTVQGTSSTNAASNTVYVSSKGIYHNTASAHNMKNSTAMSRQEAIDSGYRACEAKHCP